MRLPNGYGAIIKLKGNRRKPFQVRVTKGFKEDGKQEYMYLGYYETRAEAMKALAEYNSSPYDISTQTITFEEIFQKWSSEHYKKIGESSITNYNNAFNNYCKSLYKMRFNDIRLRHLQNVVDQSNKAFPTRKVIKTLLQGMSKYAIKNDIIDKDYTTFIDIGHNEGKSNRKPFSKEEINKLFKYVDKLEYIDTILILIYTGLRIGELLDLKIENVNLKERYMRGGLKTKAGKNRVIPINRKIEPYIRKYYEKNKENKYLIMNSLGKQMGYSNYKREKWDNIIEKLELEKHNPHDTRHTFASMMDTVGANKLCIKRIMGHSAQDLTDDVYTHKNIDELIASIDLL